MGELTEVKLEEQHWCIEKNGIYYPIDMGDERIGLLKKVLLAKESHSSRAGARELSEEDANLIQRIQYARFIQESYQQDQPYKLLCFGPAGGRIFTHIGAYQGFQEEGYCKDLEAVSGVSSGAIVSTAIALGCTPEDLEATFRKVNDGKPFGIPLSKDGIGHTFDKFKGLFIEEVVQVQLDELKKNIEAQKEVIWGAEDEGFWNELKDKEYDISFKDLAEIRTRYDFLKLPELHIMASTIELEESKDGSKKYVYREQQFSHNDQQDMSVLEAIRCSSAIPIAFRPVNIARKKDTNEGEEQKILSMGDYNGLTVEEQEQYEIIPITDGACYSDFLVPAGFESKRVLYTKPTTPDEYRNVQWVPEEELARQIPWIKKLYNTYVGKVNNLKDLFNLLPGKQLFFPEEVLRGNQVKSYELYRKEVGDIAVVATDLNGFKLVLDNSQVDQSLREGKAGSKKMMRDYGTSSQEGVRYNNIRSMISMIMLDRLDSKDYDKGSFKTRVEAQGVINDYESKLNEVVREYQRDVDVAESEGSKRARINQKIDDIIKGFPDINTYRYSFMLFLLDEVHDSIPKKSMSEHLADIYGTKSAEEQNKECGAKEQEAKELRRLQELLGYLQLDGKDLFKDDSHKEEVLKCYWELYKSFAPDPKETKKSGNGLFGVMEKFVTLCAAGIPGHTQPPITRDPAGEKSIVII